MDERILLKLESILQELRGMRALMTKKPDKCTKKPGDMMSPPELDRLIEQIDNENKVKSELKSRCLICNGKGSIPVDLKCGDCDGTGELSVPTFAQPGKRITCALCSGEGAIENPDKSVTAATIPCRTVVVNNGF